MFANRFLRRDSHLLSWPHLITIDYPMGLSTRIFIGLFAGAFTGLFFGEMVADLKIVG